MLSLKMLRHRSEVIKNIELKLLEKLTDMPVSQSIKGAL
jgi:hypothetical protein